MQNYRKAINYENFMKMSPQERKTHSNYFLQKYPEMCPILIEVQSMGKKVELRQCKFLMKVDSPLNHQIEFLRNLIIKYSNGAIDSKSALFFFYNKTLIDGNKSVKDFLKTYFKDAEKDGWLHLKASTQETF